MGKRVLRIAVGAAALLVSSVWAQQNVGIGTNTPHPTALLELYSTSKGLLIPRMTQAERDAISSPATGLLIYQTDNTPGFYYWNGTAWIPILSSSSGSGLFWSLTGNSITGTQFLGTTNAQPLVIRTNNTERMRITATGNVGIGTATPTTALHVVAASNPLRLQGVQVSTQDTALVIDANGVITKRSLGDAVKANAWSLTGNSGTSYLNFLGTTDSARLEIRVRNVPAWRAEPVAVGATPNIIGGMGFVTGGAVGATIGGGGATSFYNEVSDNYGTVAGGYRNIVGNQNTNPADAAYAFIGGGAFNFARNAYAAVAGGAENAAWGQYSFIGGGYQNGTASGATAATVVGGYANTANGAYAAIGGGAGNFAGAYSAIPGGYNLRIGNSSFGFSGQSSGLVTDLTTYSNIAVFVDVDLWLYSRDRTQASQLRLYEAQAHGSGANYVALRAPTSLSANTTYTLPADLTPTSTVGVGILQTNASGNLSWLSPAALVTGSAWALTGNSGTDPAVNFLGTTDAQPLVIRTNNTERVRVTATGNVGIGTAAPALRLAIVDAGVGLDRPAANVLALYTNNTERMRITATGNVGIGTAAPTERLQVSDGNVAITNTDNTARQLRLYEPSGSGTNFTAFRAQAQASDIIYTLPASLTPTSTVGAGILQTDASGNLSWLDPGALAAATAWALTGNSGTDPAVNFLGTTDAQPLVIRVGNQETFRFNPPGTTAPAWSIQRGGGNQRGLHAVDLQSARSAATQVASGDYSVIGGGRENTASGSYTTVGGGQSNTASGGNATVGGGQSNTASGGSATVAGGVYNTASNLYATVGGGGYDTASGYAATVGGGHSNTASGSYTTVGGGVHNTASGGDATVGGGERNTASGDYATVGGGDHNTASGQYATVGGGGWNTASGQYATVGGGFQNTASGDYSAIPGGYNLRVGTRSFGFSGQTSATQTDLSANSNIAAFVDVDLWLYSRDRTQASQLRFYEAQAHGSGANYVALRAPTSLSANTTYTLPASDGSPGQVLTTDGNGQLSWSWNSGGTIFVRKTANESVTNTTLQADDHLYATLPANSIWEVEILLRTQSAGGDGNNGGIQVQLNAPTGTSMQVFVEIRKGGSGSDLSHHWHYGWITAPNTPVGYNPIPGTTTQTGAVKLKGLVIVGSTGGTLQLYWAQNAANTSATTVYANSYMKLTRIQ
jgi:hypothetical protein